MYSIQNKKALLSLLFLFITTFPFFSQEQNVTIDWEIITGAEKYLVLIQDSRNEPVYEIPIDEPPLNLSLFPGDYRFQIEVYNKFGQKISATPWKSLEVRKALTPELGQADLALWYSNHGGFSTFIEAKGIEPGALFTLEKENLKLVLNAEVMEEGLYRLRLNEDIPEAGLWDIHLLNPSGQETVSAEAIKVKPYRRPVIDEISSNRFSRDEIFPELRIFGSGFEAESLIILSSEWDRIEVPSIHFISNNEIRIALDTKNMGVGFYNLQILNENAESFEYPIPLSIVDAESENSETLPFTGRQKHTFSSQFGAGLGIPLGITNESLKVSSPGYSVRLEVLINNSLKKGTPTVNSLSAGFSLQGLNYQYQASNDILLQQQSLSFDISYLMVPGAAIRPGFLLGGGLTLSTQLNSNLSVSASLDFHYITGFYIQIETEKALFFRHSFVFQQNLYLYENAYQGIMVIALGVWIK